jgi:hypothetical protein
MNIRPKRPRFRVVFSTRAVAVLHEGTWYAWSLASLMRGNYTECATRGTSTTASEDLLQRLWFAT